MSMAAHFLLVYLRFSLRLLLRRGQLLMCSCMAGICSIFIFWNPRSLLGYVMFSWGCSPYVCVIVTAPILPFPSLSLVMWCFYCSNTDGFVRTVSVGRRFFSIFKALLLDTTIACYGIPVKDACSASILLGAFVLIFAWFLYTFKANSATFTVHGLMTGTVLRPFKMSTLAMRTIECNAVFLRLWSKCYPLVEERDLQGLWQVRIYTIGARTFRTKHWSHRRTIAPSPRAVPVYAERKTMHVSHFLGRLVGCFLILCWQAK